MLFMAAHLVDTVNIFYSNKSIFIFCSYIGITGVDIPHDGCVHLTNLGSPLKWRQAVECNKEKDIEEEQNAIFYNRLSKYSFGPHKSTRLRWPFFSAAHDLSPSLFNIGFTVEIIWMASGYLEKIHYHS